MRQQQKKAFRALGPEVVEKRFIAADEPTPEGWHADQASALAAFTGESHVVRKEEAPEAAEEVKPRRGRPRKVVA